MNYLDELLLLYRGQPDAQARRYLLAAMARCPSAGQSLPLRDLLWRELASPAARRTLGQVLPRQVLSDHGLDAAGDPPPTAFEPLWPALRHALSLLRRGGGAVRRAASLALGRARLAAVAGALIPLAAQRDAPFDALAALAELDTPASQEALLACVQTSGRRRPELVSLLAGVPEALPVLAPLESRTDPDGRANIAMTLIDDGSPGAHALLARLVRRREPWVTAHALDALARHPAAADAPVLRGLAAHEPEEFLRALAVRAAGFARFTDSLELARAAVRDAAPRVRAAGLEALVRLGAAADGIAVARECVDDPALRVQVAALVVLGRHDAERVAATAGALAVAEDPSRRLAGAFVTGLAVGPESASVLAEMAARDPDPDVRYQAVQSLAGQPARFSVERLARLTGAADERVAIAAARALPHVEPAALPEAAAALAAALATPVPAPVRQGLLHGAGVVARRQGAGVPAALDCALSSGAPEELAGALAGLEALRGAGVDARVERLMRHPQPAVRAGAAAAAFQAGRATAVPALEALVSTSGEAALAGLAALTRCAVLLSAREAQVQHVEAGAESKQVAGTAARLREAYGTLRSRGTVTDAIGREPLPAQFAPLASRVMLLLIILGVALLVALRRPPPAAPEVSPRALIVDYARGVPRRVNTGSSTGIALNDEVRPGDRLVTGRDRELSLRAADGTAIKLEAVSELTVVSDFALAEPMGDLALDLRPRDRVTISSPPFTLLAERAQFRLMASQTEVGLRVEAGTVTVERPGAPPRRLAAGGALSLTRPASR